MIASIKTMQMNERGQLDFGKDKASSAADRFFSLVSVFLPVDDRTNPRELLKLRG